MKVVENVIIGHAVIPGALSRASLLTTIFAIPQPICLWTEERASKTQELFEREQYIVLTKLYEKIHHPPFFSYEGTACD